MTFYTLEEVGQHNTKDSCWVVVNNTVYDATNFIQHHPGGKFAILSKAGMEVSKQFKWHSNHAKQLWKLYKIGEISNPTKICCY
uniref:Cytochrome b5 heme-binding domain-containing protein n=1 Tax=viral metagenome TaxID=1070528 RepID=A0A6C0C379_9ZZZZ